MAVDAGYHYYKLVVVMLGCMLPIVIVHVTAFPPVTAGKFFQVFLRYN
jgi:hypothetical protein